VPGARRLLIGTVLLGLVTTVMILAQAGLLAHALSSAAPGAGAVRGLAGTLLVLLAVVLARAAAVHGAELTALRAAAAVKERLRTCLVRHCAGLGPAWLRRQRTGELATLATGGLDALDPYFARYLPQLVLAVAAPLAITVTVGMADWLSGLVIAVTLPVVPLFAALVGLQAKARTQRSWRLLATLSGHFLDVVQGLTTLKAFGRADAQEQVIERVTGEYRRTVLATLRIAFMSALVLELSAALATALVAVEVGLRLLYGHLDYGTALLVLLLTPEAYLPLRNASAAFHASADGTAAAQRVFEILGTPVPRSRLVPATPIRPDLRSHTIIFDGVSLAYPGRPAPVLREVNLTIGQGDRITITGENGAGKSSLFSLLLRFADPDDGVIEAGGVDVAGVPADWWRAQIGWLPQRPALFPWSVTENIALGGWAGGRAAVERAAALAGAHGFIEELPDGYDTVLNERALRLSAGQRQKIALARLFLRDAPLVLLDEPTAHLDPVSAAEVDVALSTLAADRTVIVVTHRDADAAASPAVPGRTGRHLVISNGAITEPMAAYTRAT
jgi:ATP-binding cassette subfamily C protein CydD